MYTLNIYKEVIGETFVKIDSYEEEISFITESGDVYSMYHSQDCCEYVSIEDIVGDLDDLIGSPIVLAEEVTFNSMSELDEKTRMWDVLNSVETDHDSDESSTWTYYKLGTNKGSVSIRWYGSSNGYYSESVDFEKRNND